MPTWAVDTLPTQIGYLATSFAKYILLSIQKHRLTAAPIMCYQAPRTNNRNNVKIATSVLHIMYAFPEWSFDSKWLHQKAEG